jgi:hypothetical protein
MMYSPLLLAFFAPRNAIIGIYRLVLIHNTSFISNAQAIYFNILRERILARPNYDTLIFVLISQDNALIEQAKLGMHPADRLLVFSDWRKAFDAGTAPDLIFVDLIATLKTPNRIQGYVEFAEAKISHPVFEKVPLVLISPDPSYDLDYMVGWPNFTLANLQQPVTFKHFRRATTWI